MLLKSLSSEGFQVSSEGTLCTEAMAWRALTGPVALGARMLPPPELWL